MKYFYLILATLFFSNSIIAQIYDQRISSGANDVEEQINGCSLCNGPNTSAGCMYTTSTDLELGADLNECDLQEVGLRWTLVDIPNGATIISAAIEFRADESHSGLTNLTITGELSGNALAFGLTTNNVSSRTPTAATVSWNSVASWTAGTSYTTPDISTIIQEIVNLGGWASNNSMMIKITGSGQRIAVAYETNPSLAPRLIVKYSACSVSITQSDESACMDNGTNTNSADDYFQMTFNATSSGGGVTNKYEVVLDANADGTTGSGTILNPGGTTYGTAVTVGTNSSPPFAADGSTTYNITVRDIDTPTCHADYTSSTVASCSPCTGTPIPGSVTLVKDP